MSASHSETPKSCPSPSALDVIYENAEMLVVNKPADVPMDGDLAVYPRTVESMVCEYMKERGVYDETHERLQQEGKRKKQLKFVHQLDYSTSGVLCLAFTKDMAARLAHCFEMRTTHKYYVALLHGHIPDDSHTSASAEAPTNDNPSTPFTAWVARCQEAWQDPMAVRATACTGFTEEDKEAAMAEFRQLLRRRTSVDSTGETAATTGDTRVPIVHRHRVASIPDHSTSHDGTVPDDIMGKLITSATTPSSACSLTISLPIGYDSTDAAHFRMAVTTQQARCASTSLLVLQRTHLCTSATSDARVPVTLVLLSPLTGRRHQLRVHCRAVGYPIVGDTAYCVDLPWCRCLPSPAKIMTWSQVSVSRMYLHAWRLLLPGAVTSHNSESERVAMKKKRRRETLGLSQRSDAAVSVSNGEWTEFIAPVQFPRVQIGVGNGEEEEVQND